MKGRELPFTECLLYVSPFTKEQCSHLSCSISIIIIIPNLQMRNWDSDGWSTLLNASGGSAGIWTYICLYRVRVPALTQSILPPQSQVYPLIGRLTQQPEMIAHIWANFTDKQKKHGERGKKGQWNSNTTATNKQTNKNKTHRNSQLGNKRHIWGAHTRHCCRELWVVNITNCISDAYKLSFRKRFHILNVLQELTIKKNSVVKSLCKVKSSFIIIIL